MMKIGYFCYNLSGTGPRTRARDIINAMAAESAHEVIVLTSEPEKVDQAAEVVPIHVRHPIDALRSVRDWFSDVDLVHVPINVYQAAFVRLGYWGPLVGGVGPGLQPGLMQRLLSVAIGIDVKIKTLESFQRWDKLGINTAVCTATINRDNFYPYPEEKIRKLRRERGFDAETKVLLYVGTLSESQGAHLVSGLAKKVRSDTKTEIIVAGDGPLREKFEGRDDLQYQGFVDNNRLPLYYNIADVTVIPRENDVTSNVGLESIACGTPVVTTADGIVRDVFYDRRTYLWADRNIDSIESTVSELLTDESLYHDQIERGFKAFDEMALSLTQAVETHLEVYESILPE